MWCMLMAFSGKDNHSTGIVGWQPGHYGTFTWLSLFHFGPIDGGLETSLTKIKVLKQFKRVRVIWFCLVSHILTKADVPSTKINHCDTFPSLPIDAGDRVQKSIVQWLRGRVICIFLKRHSTMYRILRARVYWNCVKTSNAWKASCPSSPYGNRYLFSLLHLQCP